MQVDASLISTSLHEAEMINIAPEKGQWYFYVSVRKCRARAPRIDLLNAHRTDTDWLDKIVSPLSDDFVLVDVPTGSTSHGRKDKPAALSVENFFCKTE